MAKSKYQYYETETIKRDQIKNADYNPRLIDEKAKKRLRANLARHGLVSALTWNKRTGNLVGGHQRLEQLDALEKNKDYELTVCVVDVDPREEATLNVQLNNPSMQGDWDMDKLAMMADEFDLDLKDDLAFTDRDIDFLFDGDDRFSELFESEEKETIREQVNAVKDAKEKGRAVMAEKGNPDFFVSIVFENAKEKEAFMRKISMPPYERYITEDQVLRLIKQ